MAFTVELDSRPIRQEAARLGWIANKAIGPATMEALTTLAYRARKAERVQIASVFDRATPFAIDSVRAVKAHRNGNTLEAGIFVASAMASIFLRLEEGGRYADGIYIADDSLKNQYGSLKRGGLTRVENLPGAFTTANAIWQRLPGERKARLLVALLGTVVYGPQFGYRVIAEEVGLTFQDELRRQLDRRLAR
jgi:hypothetical protein